MQRILFLLLLGIVCIVSDSAAASCIPDPRLPQRLSDAHPIPFLCAGFLDPTQPPYDAVGDGAHDDTSSLQRALDDAYQYRMIVRLPAARSFRVSRQLRCVQSGKPSVPREQGFQLMGEPSSGGVARRPKLILADNSTVSNNTLLYFALLCGDSRCKTPGVAYAGASMHYAAMLRGVDIDMGNNPQVAAVSMSGAQLCSIEDVRITGQAFHAGVVGLPGSGGFTVNLAVSGGQYGIVQDQYRPNPSASGVLLTNQSVAAVLLSDARGPLVLSGFVISSSAPNFTAVLIGAPPEDGATGPVDLEYSTGYSTGDTALALEDGSIDASVAAIHNPHYHDISIRNVYVSTPVAVSAAEFTLPATAGQWRLISRWSFSRSGSPIWAEGANHSTSPGHISSYPELKLPAEPKASVPPASELLDMHSWRGLPSWSPAQGAVIDIVREYGATPDWVDSTDDDGAPLQRAIDAAARSGLAVFVPHGTFHVAAPIRLKGTTRLIGAGKHVATVTTLPSYRHTEALVVSADDGNVTRGVGYGVVLSDLVLAAPATTPLMSINSPGTLLRDVRTALGNATGTAELPPCRPKVEITGRGSGRFFGLSLDHVQLPPGKGYDTPGLDTTRFTLITVNATGEGGDVHLYQASVEHLAPTRFMVQVWRSRGVHFHAFKHESTGLPRGNGVGRAALASGGLVMCHSCEDFSIFGSSGNYGIMNASLSDAVVGLYGGRNITLMGMVRKPLDGEVPGADWLHAVPKGGETVRISADPGTVLLYVD